MSDGDSTAGWGAFDAPTQAWLRKAMTRDLVDVFGERFELAAPGAADPVLAALGDAAMREAQLAGRCAMSREAVADAVRDLIRRGLVARDDDGFIARTPT